LPIAHCPLPIITYYLNYMVATPLKPSKHPLAEYIHRLESGKSLLKDTPENVLEVVGILKSYGVVLDA
jgi:hypothetical protein